MRFSAIALALTVAASATASPILEKRIIGGSPAGKNEIPFIVEFRNKFKKCTGFLINPQTVMTGE
jgi:secreted trypsin-like serine protease